MTATTFRWVSMVRMLSLAAVAAGLLWVAVPTAAANLWAVRIAGSVMRNGVANQEPDTTRDGHPREALWQGLAALNRGENEEAVESLTLAVSRDPSDAMLRLVLGRAYEREGLLKQAVAEWKASGAWLEMVHAAQRAIDSHRWDDAILCLEAARHYSPESVIAFEAQALNGKGDRTSAISLLQRAVVEWPRSLDSGAWRMLLADYLSQDKRWVEAESVYEDAIRTGNGRDAAWAYIGLGRALYYDGSGLEAALAEIRRGIALSPDEADGYVAVGDLLAAEKRYAEADSWFNQAAQRDPGDVWIVTRRVDLLLAEGRAKAAIGLAKEALVRFPGQPHLYYQLGQAYRSLGDFASALSAAETSVSLDRSGNVGYRLALASLYRRAGRREDAARTYRLVLDLDPSNATAIAALARLDAKP